MSIAAIGAGVAGLHLGLQLREHNAEVTIYTDRSADQVAAGRLLNTVAHHHHTLERERALRVHHWDAAEYGYVCHQHCVVGPPEPLRFCGDFEARSSIIDYRLYLPRLMADFEDRGGELRVAAVAAEDLDRLSPSRALALRGAAAPAQRRDLRRHRLQRAQGRRRAPLAGQRRAARAADLLARGLRHRAAVRGDPRRRPRGARRHPPQAHDVELRGAMSQNKALCDAYTQNFNHPDRQWDALASPERTAAFIARHAG